jgi:hypothetical protein
MRRMGWVYLGSTGVLGLQLLLVACGNSEKHPAVTAGGAGQTGGGTASHSGSAGKASGGSSANGGSRSESGDATDLDTFLEGVGEGFCARLFRCVEGNDDFVLERIVLKNEQGCKDLFARVYPNGTAQRDLRAQIAAGKIHYDPMNGQKCLDALGACNGIDSFNEGACREAFEGNAKTGEACTRSEDCAGDAYCGTLQACGEQCAPRKQEGEPCQADNECAHTAGTVFCDRLGAPFVCRTLLPAKAAEGEPCTRDFKLAKALTLCQDGLWCATVAGGDPEADAVGQCVLPIPADGPCVDVDDFCSDGVCNPDMGACRHLPLVADAGAACGEVAWSLCDSTLGFHCNSEGTCDASGDGSEGSACFGSDLQRSCDAGLNCAKAAESTSNDLGICRAFVADGGACNNGKDCVSGHCEDGVCGGRPCLQ